MWARWIHTGQSRVAHVHRDPSAPQRFPARPLVVVECPLLSNASLLLRPQEQSVMIQGKRDAGLSVNQSQWPLTGTRDTILDVHFETVLFASLSISASGYLIGLFSERCNCQIAYRYFAYIFLPPRRALLRVRL